MVTAGTTPRKRLRLPEASCGRRYALTGRFLAAYDMSRGRAHMRGRILWSHLGWHPTAVGERGNLRNATLNQRRDLAL